MEPSIYLGASSGLRLVVAGVDSEDVDERPHFHGLDESRGSEGVLVVFSELT
jgi:hypothetical protein